MSKLASGESLKQLILSQLKMYEGVMAIKFDKFTKQCRYHPRTKTWRAAVKDLKEEGYIVINGGYIELTEEGLASIADTDDENKLMPTTNAEHHARIKSMLMKKGPEIFDLLHERGPMSRKDLAAALKIRSGTHSFSYALAQLKDFGFVCPDPNNKRLNRLSERAFLRTTEGEK